MSARLPSLLLAVALAPAAASAAPLDGPERARVVEAVAVHLEAESYDRPLGHRAAGRLRAQLAAGAYAGDTDDAVFAAHLTADGDAVLHDGHFRVRATPDAPGAPAPADALDGQARRDHYGVPQARVLPGNIAYLEVASFYPGSVANAWFDRAFAFLGGADALIVDLRHNGGGSDSNIHLLSWLLPAGAPQTVAHIEMRQPDGTLAVWDPQTEAIAGPTFGDRPVWLLTSRRTFSAAEGFAYHTRARRAVRIVGETTGGGGHPNRVTPIDERFRVSIPVGRSTDTVTHGSWDGVGIVPDVATSAASAFAAAYAEALHALGVRDVAMPADPLAVAA